MDDVKVVPFQHKSTGKQGWAVIGRRNGWITYCGEQLDELRRYVRRRDVSEEKRIEVG